ncbi:MAG: hydrogenase formation protein HypD, partial [Thermoplasmatota archaeon]
GFETTAPTTSSLLLEDRAPDNLSILSFHRTVPPALKFIAESGEVRLSGLIEPGHVSMVIGEEPYRFLSVDHKLPQVIAGFEPLDLLMACLEIARQKADGRAELKNMYGRVVRPEGNLAAIRAMAETFEPCDVRWRGFPVIPGSGLEIARKFEDHNARKKFEDELADLQELEVPEPEGCRCGEVLRGLIDPDECPLFGRSCRPDHPTGPCMVSREGGCNILYRWGRNLV